MALQPMPLRGTPPRTRSKRPREANGQAQRSRPGGTDGDHSKGPRPRREGGVGRDSSARDEEETGMNLMNGNFRIGRFGGVDVRINWSLIVVFALIVWSLTDGFFPSTIPGLPEGHSLAMAIAAVVFFLASILLHELGHSWVARREGIE